MKKSTHHFKHIKNKKKSYSTGYFNRERMVKALSSERKTIPHGLTPQEIIAFILTS